MKRSDSLPCTSRCCTGHSAGRVLRCMASTAQAPCPSQDDCCPIHTCKCRAPLDHCAARGRSPSEGIRPGSHVLLALASASPHTTHTQAGILPRGWEWGTALGEGCVQVVSSSATTLLVAPEAPFIIIYCASSFLPTDFVLNSILSNGNIPAPTFF